MSAEKYILLKSDDIQKRIAELAAEMSDLLQNEKFDILWLAEGAFYFAADLTRLLPFQDIQIHSLKVSSYGAGKKSSENPLIIGDISKFRGRNVLIVDDIFDTGKTLEFVSNELKKIGAKKIMSCFLLNKKVEKLTDAKPDFVGFDIEDRFVFGYGLDSGGVNRNLPDIWAE